MSKSVVRDELGDRVEYRKSGLLHRLDGPAVYYLNNGYRKRGTEEYYNMGERYYVIGKTQEKEPIKPTQKPKEDKPKKVVVYLKSKLRIMSNLQGLRRIIKLKLELLSLSIPVWFKWGCYALILYILYKYSPQFYDILLEKIK